MHISKLSLRSKFFLLFLIPALTLVYFSIYFISSKYTILQQSTHYKEATQKTHDIMQLIRNIQIERGLSTGYLGDYNSKSIKKALQQQYLYTDKSIQKFHNLLKKQITTIRTKVLQHHISVNEELDFYTTLNKKLIESVKSHLTTLEKQGLDSPSLLHIELLKEYAGLERACVYNQLLSIHIDPSCRERIIQFRKLQQENKNEFFLHASGISKKFYKNSIDTKNFKELQKLRSLFCITKNKHEIAQKWFQVTTQYIDSLNTLSHRMLQRYINISTDTYKKAKQSLYFALILWLISFFAALYFLYIINKLLKKEQKNMQELRIASYTFDSHEAITITDTEGTILKINKGFTRITGYTEEEAIGKKPNILKSDKHDEAFYENMWHLLLTEGKWSKDIYNKRKNGEVYPERLSITAIKDKNGKTMNYIAQFLDISDIKNAQEEAQYQADHDFLTHLLNRKSLLERLHEELNRAHRHNFNDAFLFIDLDHFKQVNDTYGHDVGDKVLIHVANTLTKITREEDIVARISGDEFGIVLVNIEDEDQESIVENIAHKIIYELSKEIDIDNTIIKIGCSVGIRIFPHADDDVDRIIKDADSAMYNVKFDGKGKFLFF